MEKILTAINNEKLVKKILKNNITKNKNILYKEAIVETVKKNKNINIIIISENIPGEIDFIKLIKSIKKINKKIKIFIILSNKKIEKELIKINITEIYYDNIFSIYKLLKKFNKKNYFFYKIKNKMNYKIINKIKNSKKTIQNNVIYLFGKNKMDVKIVELIILKKLIMKNKSIIIMNLKINLKKQKSKIKINNQLYKKNNFKKKYFLKIKFNNLCKEIIINKNIREVKNINQLLKDNNQLVKLKILKNIIENYKKSNKYIILNINHIENIKQFLYFNQYIKIICLDNNINNLKYLNETNYLNKNIDLIINNYKKNNLSKYFYKMFLKNKYKKIKILNLY